MAEQLDITEICSQRHSLNTVKKRKIVRYKQKCDYLRFRKRQWTFSVQSVIEADKGSRYHFGNREIGEQIKWEERGRE